MRSTRKFALGASLLASFAIVGSTGGGAVLAQEEPAIVVGSDGFYESVLAAEIWAQALESAGYEIDRAGLAIGTRATRIEAFEAGQIDLMAEYVGNGLEFFTDAEGAADNVAAIEVSGNPEVDAGSLEQVYALRGFDVSALGLSTGQDQNAAVVRPETAEQYDLSTMSDLAAVQGDLRWGLPPECSSNPGCKLALETYGVTYPPENLSELGACGAEIAGALEGDAIDLAWLCSTQPIIGQNGWIVLEDDLQTQPPGNLVPIINNEVADQLDGGADAIAAILDPISAELTTDVLTELGVRIAVDQEDIEDVAAEFLAGLGS